MLNLYRPPGPTASFFVEFQDVVSHLATFSGDLLIMGDFNLHVDISSKQTEDFQDILASLDLFQYVDFPTHIRGHTLDLMITSNRNTSKVLSVLPSDRISDHLTVVAELDVPVPTHKEKKMISYRNIKGIDIEAFKADIAKSELLTDPCRSITDLAKQYWDCLVTILNRHAPLQTKYVSPKPPNPWMTPEILEAKRRRRYLERQWRRNPTALNRSRYSQQAHLCNRLMSKAKRVHYDDIIGKNSDDQKNLWKAFSHILHRCPTPKLPGCLSLVDLAERFSSYFVNKIQLIRAAFPSATTANDDHEFIRPNFPDLNVFPLASEEEVRRIIMAAPNKSCDLDPIPTPLLKLCIDVVITPITSMVNMSLSHGIFPSCFKTAHVSPLLKKPSLSNEEMKNYRPVSNLSFI